MAVDLGRKRLFIAEIGNGSLDVVDLRGGRQIQRITGLAEPQGVGYAPKADLVAVANGGDGSVRFFRGGALTPEGAVALASDADDVRVDPRTGDIVVGYGSGGLAVVDPDKRSKIGDVRLAAHPEGFAVDPATGRAYVNVPGAGQIAVVDLVSGRQVATWAVPDLRANFPIALDAAGTIVATVFRHPPKLVLVDARTGAATARLDACGDADDVFFDAKRARIYVVCGAGIVDVLPPRRRGRMRGWRGSRPPRGRARHCSCPNSTGCSSPPAPVRSGPTPRSLCFARCRDPIRIWRCRGKSCWWRQKKWMSRRGSRSARYTAGS